MHLNPNVRESGIHTNSPRNQLTMDKVNNKIIISYKAMGSWVEREVAGFKLFSQWPLSYF